jgi:hypothetical protein
LIGVVGGRVLAIDLDQRSLAIRSDNGQEATLDRDYLARRPR